MLLLWTVLLPLVAHFTEEMTISKNFWVTTELVSVKWNSNCDAINDCGESMLSITQTNVVNGERVLKQWNFVKFTRSQYRSMLVGYWSDGEPEAITLKAEILGTDPNYGFQRLCDSSSTAALFPLHRTRGQAAYVFNNGTVVETIELVGSCFTAAIAYSKFVKQCPWCSPVRTSDDRSNTVGREKIAAGRRLTFGLSTEIILSLLLVGLLLLFVALILCMFFMCRSPNIKQTPSLPPPLPSTFPNRGMENVQWRTQCHPKNNMIFPKANYFATDFSKDTSFMSIGFNRNSRPLSVNSSEGYMSLPQ